MIGLPPRFLLPILTCYIKKQPAEVQEALQLLKQFRGEFFFWKQVLLTGHEPTPNKCYRSQAASHCSHCFSRRGYNRLG